MNNNIYILLPNELIIKIFNFSIFEVKIEMMKVFLWLKNITYKCNYCKNKSYIMLNFKHYNECWCCGEYKKYDEIIFLCNLNCKHLYSILYNSIIYNTNKIKATYLIEKDECNKCGRRNMYEIDINGIQIQAFPKSELEKNVENFINIKLIKKDNSSIRKGFLIYLYKKMYNINSKNKNFYRELSHEFHKKLSSLKKSYIGYELALNEDIQKYE